MHFSCLENFSRVPKMYRVLSGIHQDRSFIDLQCWCFSGFWMGHFILVYDFEKWICNHSAEWVFFLSKGKDFFSFVLFIILTYRYVMLLTGSKYNITDYTFWWGFFVFFFKCHWPHHTHRGTCIFLHFSNFAEVLLYMLGKLTPVAL